MSASSDLPLLYSLEQAVASRALRFLWGYQSFWREVLFEMRQAADNGRRRRTRKTRNRRPRSAHSVRRETPAHHHVLRPCRFDSALGSARSRGHARDHRRVPPLLRSTDQQGRWVRGEVHGGWGLAYFGYPQAHEDDAERTVRAAFVAGRGDPEAAHRTWRHTPGSHRHSDRARVVGDLIGEGDAQERGVGARTPNLAARLQALAEPGQVVISQSTRHLTGGLFEYRDLGRCGAQGIGPSGPGMGGDGCYSTCKVALKHSTRQGLRRWLGAKRNWSCCCGAGNEPRR